MRESDLFANMTEQEFESAIKYINAYILGRRYYHLRSMGLVLSGSVMIESNDIWGNAASLVRATSSAKCMLCLST